MEKWNLEFLPVSRRRARSRKREAALKWGIVATLFATAAAWTWIVFTGLPGGP